MKMKLRGSRENWKRVALMGMAVRHLRNLHLLPLGTDLGTFLGV